MTVSSPPVIGALCSQARPRVMAALVRAFRDVDFAEDLFQECCVKALEAWPKAGTPDDVVAWLIRVGRNAGIDRVRRQARVSATPVEDVLEGRGADNDIEARIVEDMDDAAYKDDVLRLMFMCCHADLKPTDQLALALKVVVGFSVPEVARAFLVTPDTMERRISRAKKRAAGVATVLDTPTAMERGRRLNAVSAMVYLLFNEGYSAGSGDAHIRMSLCDEAIRLARLLLDLFPGQTEVMGLLALCLLQHSRSASRLDATGELIALDEQDRSLWDQEMIAEGLVLVEKALRKGRPDNMQIQAAIAAVHCSASTADATDWGEIDRLYAALEVVQPSPVVTLNRAVAVSKVAGAEAALEMIDPLSDDLARYQPFHSTRAAFLEMAGAFVESALAFERALQLSPTEAERRFLSDRLAEVSKKIG